jgi:hypothetical protein
MSTHTHAPRPIVSDINSETWRLACTARAAQELRDYALYGPQPPPTSASAYTFTGPYYLSSPVPTSTPSLTWPPTPDFS